MSKPVVVPSKSKSYVSSYKLPDLTSTSFELNNMGLFTRLGAFVLSSPDTLMI